MIPGRIGALCAFDSRYVPGTAVYADQRPAAGRRRRYQDNTKVEPSTWRADVDRSCARHNGMTGAGSDQDVGPTPVQRARFRDKMSLEASMSQDLLATTGMYLMHIRLAVGRSDRVLGTEIRISPVLAPAASIRLFPITPRQNDVVFDVLPSMGSP